MCIYYVFINLYMIYILLTITKTIYILIKNIFKNKIKNIKIISSVYIWYLYSFMCRYLQTIFIIITYAIYNFFIYLL